MSIFYADFILNQEMWLFVLLDMADVHCLLSWACILFFNLSWGVSLACKRTEEHTSHIWPPVVTADGYSGLVPIPRLSSLGMRLPAYLLKCQDCESMGMRQTLFLVFAAEEGWPAVLQYTRVQSTLVYTSLVARPHPASITQGEPGNGANR